MIDKKDEHRIQGILVEIDNWAQDNIACHLKRNDTMQVEYFPGKCVSIIEGHNRAKIIPSRCTSKKNCDICDPYCDSYHISKIESGSGCLVFFDKNDPSGCHISHFLYHEEDVYYFIAQWEEIKKKLLNKVEEYKKDIAYKEGILNNFHI